MFAAELVTRNIFMLSTLLIVVACLNARRAIEGDSVDAH
jgi:hypothetical protein